jgi:two-component system sensor histidine kinase YesM
MLRNATVNETSNNAKDMISSFSWLDAADAASSFCVLGPHRDFLSRRQDALVYGIVEKVAFSGKEIGYIEVDKSAEELDSLTSYVDEEDILVQIYFSDGSLLYVNGDDPLSWPDSLPLDEYTHVTLDQTDTKYDVYHTYLEQYGLHLVIAQDASVIDANRNMLRAGMFRRVLYIMIPTIAVIIPVSLNLTSSIQRLTKKVRQIPTQRVLTSDPEVMRALTQSVTSPVDQEPHELERVLTSLLLQLKEKASTELTLREGALQARLSALQTQINPHFIYNTLNIISAKSMESGNFDVIEICDQFAQMLRYSTDTQDRAATMAEEIENVRNYLMLAKARYEDDLEYVIDVPESLNEITVPKLTLQPLVENALTHGFNGINIKRVLSVSGYVLADKLVLEIRDNGTGFSEEMLKSLRYRIHEIEDGKVSIESAGGHIGLVNTCLRLYYYSKGAMRVAVSNDNGAVVTMTFPAAGNAKK